MNRNSQPANWQLFRAATAVAICLLWGLFPPLGLLAFATPVCRVRASRPATSHQESPPSSVEVAFRQAVSSIRDGFPPSADPTVRLSSSCSAYAARAISEQGALIGLLMTADRLTRCHIWKKPGAD